MDNNNEDIEQVSEVYQEDIPSEVSDIESVAVDTVKFVGCTRHNDLPFIGECLICGKKLCRECRDERGYFCSDACLGQSKSSVDTEARQEFQKNLQSSEKIAKIIKTVFMACAAIVLIWLVWWVYVEFLDPAGSMAWQWKIAPPTSDLILIGHNQDSALVKRDTKAVFIDLLNGKEISSEENEILGRCKEFVQRTEDGGVILRNDKSIAMLNKDGKLAWSKKFDNMISTIVVAEGDAVLVVNKPETDIYTKAKAEDITAELTVLELKNGARRWKKEYSDFKYLYDIVAGSGKFVQALSTFDNKKYESYLEVSDLKSGDALWRIKSEKTSGSSLIIVGNILMFKLQNTLSAVDLKTAKKLWNVPMKGWAWKKNIRQEGDNILIDNGETMTLVNSKDGKKIWEKPIPDYLDSSTNADGKIYSVVLVYEESKEEEVVEDVKLPPAFDQLKDFDTLSGGKPVAIKSRGKNTGFLVCRDMATGNELWKVENVRGTCVAGNGKLVVVNDTSQNSMLNMTNDGLGSIIIRQFNPQNGKELFHRRNSAGLSAPYFIVNDKLVGVEYERIRTGIGGMMGQAKQYYGLTAFLLK